MNATMEPGSLHMSPHKQQRGIVCTTFRLKSVLARRNLRQELDRQKHTYNEFSRKVVRTSSKTRINSGGTYTNRRPFEIQLGFSFRFSDTLKWTRTSIEIIVVTRITVYVVTKRGCCKALGKCCLYFL